MNGFHPCRGGPGSARSVLDDPGGRLNRILSKTAHAPSIREFAVFSPAIARAGRPGQFVIVRRDETAERIPLTIADADPAAGTVTLVMHIVGQGSRKLDELRAGDRFRDLVGPLGTPSEIGRFGTVAFVSGGLGVAPAFPIQRAMREAGNRVISIVGARNAGLLFWLDRMAACADQLLVCTDDGSAGEKALVATPLKRLLDQGEKIDRVVAIGPPPMMRAVAELTRGRGVKTIVSLNALMVDGTGMCGCCRVEVGGQTKFTCVDGPEFDAHEVDFARFASRLSAYREQEDAARESRPPTGVDSPSPAPDAGSVEAAVPPAAAAAPETRAAGGPGPSKASKRVEMPVRDPAVRRRDFAEVATGYSEDMARSEAARCVQCKKPACVDGCPVRVRIPEFIALVRDGKFAAAARKIKETNNLPAICGRVCPQETQCEARCVLGKPRPGPSPSDGWNASPPTGKWRRRPAGATRRPRPIRFPAPPVADADGSPWWVRVRRAWPPPPISRNWATR